MTLQKIMRKWPIFQKEIIKILAKIEKFWLKNEKSECVGNLGFEKKE